MNEFFNELNDILVLDEHMIAPTSSGIAIKKGFLVATYETCQEALDELKELEYLTEEQHLVFTKKLAKLNGT